LDEELKELEVENSGGGKDGGGGWIPIDKIYLIILDTIFSYNRFINLNAKIYSQRYVDRSNSAVKRLNQQNLTHNLERIFLDWFILRTNNLESL
jgi:hypothetical protein